VIAWGKTAELCGEHLSKGRQVLITGKNKTSSWEDDYGNKRYTTEVQVKTVEFLGNRDDRSEPPAEESDHPDPDFNDDDVPF